MSSFLFIIISFIFPASALELSAQFHGYYHDYLTHSLCRLLPAVATVTISNGHSTLKVDAPGAQCEPPQFFDGGDVFQAGLFSEYQGVPFKAQGQCPYRNPKRAVTFMFKQDVNTGAILDPFVTYKSGGFSQTIFTTRQRTILPSCTL